jgi:DNA-binding winged helix-turn-helix (wHTH) protein
MSMPMTTGSVLATRSQGISEAKLAESRYLCFGRFQLDLVREELFKDGARIHVPAKVYQVLLALLERPGDIVTREDLRARLWPGGTFVNYDANVNTSVNKLRFALGDSPDEPIYVETIPRQGYCFVGTVERRNVLAKGLVADADQASGIQAAAPSAPWLGTFRGRLSGFFASGWAAALLLCGVLIGIGIVLVMHRPL